MTKEQYFELKAELKALASQIKETKNNFKPAQREFSHFEKEVGNYDTTHSTKKHEGPNWDSLYSKMTKLQSQVLDLKHDYRAKHIVYSLARGRTIEQIEGSADKENYWYDYIHRHVVPGLLKKYDIQLPQKEEVVA